MTSPPSGLPPVRRVITTHDPITAKAVFCHSFETEWTGMECPLYTTSESMAVLHNDDDIVNSNKLFKSETFGIVNPKGSVCRIVDFAPGLKPIMHRTKSLDYGIVILGSMQLLLDSGEKQILHAGDVVIQRGTMHGWSNPSATEWARVCFVMLSRQEIKVGGEVLEEYVPDQLRGHPEDK